ncbi:MAG: hypothetical protein AAF560_32215 [Acidobacteriota bacterium]
MTRVKVFNSFEEENAAERRRRARMTPEERLTEFAIVQKRAWGEDWATQPIVKTATWEKVTW